ncbi:MAG: transglutaminase domain-containing protein [bacterium]|nr:transglutaminase domain-containing protein [bacterium]
MRFACLISMSLLIAPFVTGQEATYLMAGQQLPVLKNSNGYVQAVAPQAGDWVKVRVSVSYGAVGVVGRYDGVDNTSSLAPVGFEIPEGLGLELRDPQSAWSAATAALRWAATKISHDEDDMLPQDAGSVLQRGRGRCSGIANAAAALLMAAGFEARTVSGLLMTEDGPIAHRWIECNLPGAGWVPSDPTLGLWVLTPRHLAFDSAVSQLPQIREIKPSEVSLSGLPREDGILSRPNLGSELVCRLVETDGREGKIMARLSGPTGEVLSGELNPVYRFTKLLPGSWRLEVERDGQVLERHRLRINRGETHSLAVVVKEQMTEVDS